MRMYTAGVKVPKRGSVQDRVLQSFLVKESEREIKKTQFLAFIAMNTMQASTQEALSEQNGKIKKVWNKYLELEYGLELPEQTEKEILVAEYYDKVVKKLKPRLVRKKGKLSVEGISALTK